MNMQSSNQSAEPFQQLHHPHFSSELVGTTVKFGWVWDILLSSLCSYKTLDSKTSSAHLMTDIVVMAVGVWAERQPLKVTLYQHLAQSKGKYCLELIFLKIPWRLLEWSLGGGRSNCKPGRTISTLQSLGTACAAVVFVQAGERFPNPLR